MNEKVKVPLRNAKPHIMKNIALSNRKRIIFEQGLSDLKRFYSFSADDGVGVFEHEHSMPNVITICLQRRGAEVIEKVLWVVLVNPFSKPKTSLKTVIARFQSEQCRIITYHHEPGQRIFREPEVRRPLHRWSCGSERSWKGRKRERWQR